MKVVKQAAEYTIFQRRDGRHAVRGTGRNWVNGDDKVAVLVKEGFLKQEAPKPKPKAEEQEADTAEDASEQVTADAGGESEAS